MRKLTLPHNPHKGLKIFCRTCRIDNPKCKHYDRQVFRVRIHIPGNSKSIRTKFLEAGNYNNAVAECVDFERELKSNGINALAFYLMDDLKYRNEKDLEKLLPTLKD